MKNPVKWYCPICGLDLTDLSHDKNGIETDVTKTMEVLDYEICPSCGFQFGIGGDGFGIEKDRIFYRKWRQKWIDEGMKWWSKDDKYHPQPQNWDPKKQLENIPKEFR